MVAVAEAMAEAMVEMDLVARLEVLEVRLAMAASSGVATEETVEMEEEG